MTDARVSREHVEVLHENAPEARVSREHVEVLHEALPDARVSREHVEVLHDANPDIRVSTFNHDLLIQIAPEIQVSQMTVEVLYGEQNQRVTVNKAYEVDSAQQIYVPQSITLGIATETDIARLMPRYIPVQTAVETDTADTTTYIVAQSIVVNRAESTETAQHVQVVKVLTIANEADTAQPITARVGQSIALNQATESDEAQAIPLYTVVLFNVSVAVELDEARQAKANQQRELGLAEETDSALGPIKQAHPVGTAVETDQAEILVNPFGTAYETDTPEEIYVQWVGNPNGENLIPFSTHPDHWSIGGSYNEPATANPYMRYTAPMDLPPGGPDDGKGAASYGYPPYNYHGLGWYAAQMSTGHGPLVGTSRKILCEVWVYIETELAGDTELTLAVATYSSTNTNNAAVEHRFCSISPADNLPGPPPNTWVKYSQIITTPVNRNEVVFIFGYGRNGDTIHLKNMSIATGPLVTRVTVNQAVEEVDEAFRIRPPYQDIELGQASEVDEARVIDPEPGLYVGSLSGVGIPRWDWADFGPDLREGDIAILSYSVTGSGPTLPPSWFQISGSFGGLFAGFTESYTLNIAAVLFAASGNNTPPAYDDYAFTGFMDDWDGDPGWYLNPGGTLPDDAQVAWTVHVLHGPFRTPPFPNLYSANDESSDTHLVVDAPWVASEGNPSLAVWSTANSDDGATFFDFPEMTIEPKLTEPEAADAVIDIPYAAPTATGYLSVRSGLLRETFTDAIDVEFTDYANLNMVGWVPLYVISTFQVEKAAEVDEALPIGVVLGSQTITVQTAVETDQAQDIAVQADGNKTLVRAEEADYAQPISTVFYRTLSAATEPDTAQVITPALIDIRTVNIATETDEAQSITVYRPPRTITVNIATETDTARPCSSNGFVQFVIVDRAEEIDTAVYLAVNGQMATVGLAQETDTAFALVSYVSPGHFNPGSNEPDKARFT